MCRSRRELSNEYLLDEIGVDTAENELLQVLFKIIQYYSIVSLLAPGVESLRRRRAFAKPVGLRVVPGSAKQARRARRRRELALLRLRLFAFASVCEPMFFLTCILTFG